MRVLSRLSCSCSCSLPPSPLLRAPYLCELPLSVASAGYMHCARLPPSLPLLLLGLQLAPERCPLSDEPALHFVVVLVRLFHSESAVGPGRGQAGSFLYSAIVRGRSRLSASEAAVSVRDVRYKLQSNYKPAGARCLAEAVASVPVRLLVQCYALVLRTVA